MPKFSLVHLNILQQGNFWYIFLIIYKLWKILKEMGIPDHLICLLRNLYAGQEQQLELDIEQQTGSK